MKIASLLLMVLLLACASPIRTRHDTAPDADFSRYRTYAWIRHDPEHLSSRTMASGGGFISPLDDRRIRDAVDAELQAKGYRKVTGFELADLVVRYRVGREEKVQVTATAGSDRVYTRYGHGTWYSSSPVNVSTYTEGTLSVEFFDRASREAVWVGWAQKRLSRNDDSASVIKRAVDATLEPLPPAGG